jgi:enoyl-CoA hydratase/carnithine racemase
LSKSNLVHFEEIPCTRGLLGIITLNNPSSLNALTLDMFQSMQAKLLEWRTRDDIRLVYMHSESAKAFCAGGDVKNLAIESAQNPKTDLVENFFWWEYGTDLLVHEYVKPIVCWLDGITMGGGVGLTTGASHRIVTERSLLAMPELNIGFFPDVGAGFFLNQLPEPVSLFLAWTGARLNAADALHLKLVDMCLPSKMKEGILNVITQTEWSDSDEENHWQLSNILGGAESDLPPSQMAAAQETILRDFNSQGLEDALVRYLGSNHTDKWLRGNLENFRKSSPLSAHVTYHHFKRTRGLSSDQVLAQDWSLAVALVRKGDFHEGIRSVLIDKTNDAKWKNPGFGNVPSVQVDEILEPNPRETEFFNYLKTLSK